MAVVLLSLAAGCAGPPKPRITRVLDGEARRGTFVSPYAYEHFVRGELARVQGDLDAAARFFRQTRTSAGADPVVLARLARVLDRQGHLKRARRVLAEGRRHAPHSEALHLARARIAERHGRAERAVAAYEAAAEAAPESDTAPLALARLLRRQGDEGRAQAVLRAYAERAGGGTAGAARARLRLARMRGDIAAAVAAVELLVRLAPARTEEVRRTAKLALRKGQPVLAARLLEHVPRKANDAPLRIRALLAAGDDAAAEGLLATTPPEAFGGLTAKARFYLDAGRPDRAEELAEAAATGGSDPDAWLVAGRAELSQGRWTEAAMHLARVPRGARGYARARLALGHALQAGGLAHLGTEVLAHARRELGDRAPLSLRRRLARARLARGDVEGALGLLEGPEPAVRAARARALERAGRPEAASALFRELPLDGAKLGPSIRTRARAERLVANGEIPRAVELLSRHVDRAPESTWARVRLAELLARVDRNAEARELARKTLDLVFDPHARARLSPLTR